MLQRIVVRTAEDHSPDLVDLPYIGFPVISIGSSSQPRRAASQGGNLLADLLASYATASVDNDSEAFRRANEDADVLIPDAPVPTQTVVEQMAIFYDMVRDRGPRTMTGEYAAAVAYASSTSAARWPPTCSSPAGT